MAGRHGRSVSGVTQDAQRCDGMRQQGRLRILRGPELLLGPFSHQGGEGETQHLVGGLERRGRDGVPVGQSLRHPDGLGSLTGKDECE